MDDITYDDDGIPVIMSVNEADLAKLKKGTNFRKPPLPFKPKYDFVVTNNPNSDATDVNRNVAACDNRANIDYLTEHDKADVLKLSPVFTRNAKKSQASVSKQSGEVNLCVQTKDNGTKMSSTSVIEANNDNTESIAATSTALVSHTCGWEVDLTGLFHIHGVGYDVTFKSDRICLKPIDKGGRRKSSGRRKLSGIFRSLSRQSLDDESVDSDFANQENNPRSQSILMKDIFGMRIKRRRSEKQAEGEGTCLGIVIISVEQKHINRLKPHITLLSHPSEMFCEKWEARFNRAVKGFSRPKKVKLFLQQYAGKKDGNFMFKSVIEPLFTHANIKLDIQMIKYNEHIKQEMIHIELSDYDSFVCMGGDGTANRLINGVLNKAQHEAGIVITKTGFSPIMAPVTVGIIPTGTTNHIAHSVMGTEDAVTGAMHVILGHSYPVDISSVSSEDQMIQWAFNSQYGFGGTVLQLRERYAVLGVRKMEAAFVKSLTKAKLRPYDCEIEFLPSAHSSRSNTDDGVICFNRCSVCCINQNGDETTSKVSDEVEELDPLGGSNTSSLIMDLSEESKWRTLKGTYLNVGLFTVPGRCEFAPCGLSKFTHLSDGSMDLVLVKDVDRKQFIRYLKRHGTSKNQFALPFIETHRVQQVRFRPRYPTTWNYRNYDYSEIDYEVDKSKKKSKMNQSLDLVQELHLSDEDDDDDDEEEQKHLDTGQGVENMAFISQSLTRDSLDTLENSDTESAHADDNQENQEKTSRQCSPAAEPPDTSFKPRHRPTFTDAERLKRRQRQRKKDEKKKSCEETKLKSVWSLDNEMITDLDLDFRVHSGLLSLCAQGISPDTHPDEVKVGCLPAF